MSSPKAVEAGVDEAVPAVTMPPLVTIFLLTFFIPDGIDVEIGALQITPMRAVGLALMPILLLRERIRWAVPDYLAIAYLVAGFVSFTRSSGFGPAIEATGRLSLDILLPYLVARWVAQQPDLFRQTVRIMLGCLSVAAVLAVIESLLRVNLWMEMWSLFGEVGRPIHPETRLGLVRSKVWANHPIMLGLAFVAWLPLVLACVGERWIQPVKYPGPMIALFLLAIFLSLSSAAWLGAGIVLALFAWEKFGGRSPAGKWQLAWVGVPFLYYTLEMLSGRPLLRLMMMKLHITSSGAWHYRWRLFTRVKEAMPGYEWFGHGLERPTGFQSGFASSIDNHFLLVILQRGRVGLWLWVAWMLSVCLYLGRNVWFGRDSAAAHWARAACFTVIALALMQFSVALFSAAGRMFWFVSGLAVGMALVARAAAHLPHEVPVEDVESPAVSPRIGSEGLSS